MLNLDFLSQSSLYTPAPFKYSCVKGTFINSGIFCPIGKRFCLSAISQKNCSAGVVHLPITSHPSTIVGSVVTIVVDSIYFVIGGRPFSHILEKILKFRPTIDVSNPSTAISLIGAMSRVIASLFHGAPTLIGRGISSKTMSMLLPSSTAAAFILPLHKHVGGFNNRRATLAFALKKRVPVFYMRKGDDFKNPIFIPNKIEALHKPASASKLFKIFTNSSQSESDIVSGLRKGRSSSIESRTASTKDNCDSLSLANRRENLERLNMAYLLLAKKIAGVATGGDTQGVTDLHSALRVTPALIGCC